MVRVYVRKSNRAEYPATTLKQAVERVRSGELTMAAASRQFSVPKTTLFQRIKGTRGMKSGSLGRPTALPPDTEKRMASAIMKKWGFGLSKNEIVLAIAQFVQDNQIQTPFEDSVPGDDYIQGFMRRNGLSQKKPQLVEVARKRNVDPFLVHQYFELVAEITTGIPPERIYNVDESSFCLDPTRIKVVGKKGAAAHRVTAGPGRENITVLMGGNAAGDKLPPLIIFKGKNIWDTWLAEKASEFPGLSYAATSNGWMDMETFADYFRNTFMPAIPKTRPVVLIYDGHSSHTSMLLVEEAMRNNIIILKLPSHTSHLLQPMDLTVFRPLKMQYDTLLIKWQRKNYGKKLPKSQFASIISKAWSDFDAAIIRSGFEKGGIYPFNNSVIPEEKYDIGAMKRFRERKERLEPADENRCPNCNTVTVASNLMADADDCSSEQSFHGFDEKELANEIKNNPFSIGTRTNPQNGTDKQTFEEILLQHVKQQPSTSKKKTRVCGNAEVITSPEVLRKLKEKADQKEALQQKKLQKKRGKNPRI